MQHYLIPLCIGIGLSAACGFRVFVPLFVMSLAANTGYLTIDPSMQWLASTPAVVALGVATALEIGAFYIPWLDNLLDSIATPAAVVAGAIATASMVTGMDPLLQWSVAVIAGGGVAGAVQVMTVATRAVSTAATGGVGNPVVATGETGASTVMSLLAIVLPWLAAALVIVVLGWVAWAWARRRRRRRANRLPVEASPPASGIISPQGAKN